MFPDFRSPKAYVSLILLIVMFIVPVVTGTPFWTNLFVLLFVFSALSVAWNIVGGYAGQLSLGHAVFYGIGGYTATLLTQNFGISPWFGMLVARSSRPWWPSSSATPRCGCAVRSSRWPPSPSWKWCGCW